MAPVPGSSEWRLGPVQVSQGWHGRGSAPTQGLAVLIPTDHPLTIRQANLETILRPPLDLMVVAAGSRDLETSGFRGWRLIVDPERLCQLAAELSEHHLSPGRCRRRLQGTRPLQPRRSPERDLLRALLQLLQLSRSLPPAGEPTLELLGLERAMERAVVLLLAGDLILSSRTENQAVRGSKTRIIDELQQWILANLHRPIQLDELVAQSGYSQRSLRSIFHERFGCGPIQWIRQQRLQQARARMLEPDADDSVSSVALACGYSHLSQFSRDFRAIYGIRPSELLREGRRGLTSQEL
jgi:AraC-like DNA-binding protein